MRLDEALRWWQALHSLELRRLHRLDRLLPWWDGREVRRHSIPELVVVLAGAARLCTGPRTHLDLVAGDAVLVQPWVWFDEPRPIHGAVLNLGWSQVQGVVQITTREDFWEGALPRPLVEEGARALAAAGAGLAPARALLARLATAEPRAAAMDPALRGMCELLWRHRTKPITAAQLVAASGLGRTKAFALFAAWFGRPPKTLLLEQRLDLARRLLADGVPVAAVAAECGFRTRREFTRRFRLVHGRAPRAWVARTSLETR